MAAPKPKNLLDLKDLTPQEVALLVDGLMELPGKRIMNMLNKIGNAQARLVASQIPQPPAPPTGDKK